MPAELPYLPSYKNVALLFDKIRTAKRPEAFTQNFLHDTLGLKSSGDRALISLLKTLGFLDASGIPTQSYDALKNEQVAGRAIADGVRSAYAPLFAADETANTLSRDKLKGLVSQVAGTDTQLTSKILGTFTALVDAGDWSGGPPVVDESPKDDDRKPDADTPPDTPPAFKGMNPEFHYNIQVHLPQNGTEETYMNIFNALRKVFK